MGKAICQLCGLVFMRHCSDKLPFSDYYNKIVLLVWKWRTWFPSSCGLLHIVKYQTQLTSSNRLRYVPAKSLGKSLVVRPWARLEVPLVQEDLRSESWILSMYPLSFKHVIFHIYSYINKTSEVKLETQKSISTLEIACRVLLQC